MAASEAVTENLLLSPFPGQLHRDHLEAAVRDNAHGLLTRPGRIINCCTAQGIVPPLGP